MNIYLIKNINGEVNSGLCIERARGSFERISISYVYSNIRARDIRFIDVALIAVHTTKEIIQKEII